MSKRHKTIRNNSRTTQPQTSKRTVPIAVGIALLVVAVVCGSLWWRQTNHAQASSSTQPLAAGQSAAAAKPDFEKLKGKWVRTDGGYVLEVKQVAADGKIDATYLNPKPINVSIAHVSPEAGKMNVFVELRDRGYPGNYYKLTYNAGKDQLAGVYYHVGIGQQFDVFFERIK